MKKIISILAFISLSGCTVIDAYLMTKYDPVEYNRITAIRGHATEYAANCDDVVASRAHATLIANETAEFEMYSEHIPRNDDNFAASKSLNEIAQGLKKQYDTNDKVSAMFCKIKFNGIATSANLIQSTLGKRPR